MWRERALWLGVFNFSSCATCILSVCPSVRPSLAVHVIHLQEKMEGVARGNPVSSLSSRWSPTSSPVRKPLLFVISAVRLNPLSLVVRCKFIGPSHYTHQNIRLRPSLRGKKKINHLSMTVCSKALGGRLREGDWEHS